MLFSIVVVNILLSPEELSIFKRLLVKFNKLMTQSASLNVRRGGGSIQNSNCLTYIRRKLIFKILVAKTVGWLVGLSLC